MKATTFDESPGMAVQDRGHGVFCIRIADAQTCNTLAREPIRQLRRALDSVANLPALRVLILEGSATDFLHGARSPHDEAIEQGLYRSIASFPSPVIAAMRGGASGAGFLLGALCDFMVCSEEASYGFSLPGSGLFATREEVRLLDARFGRARATDLLDHRAPATGRQLRERGWTCAILPAERVEPHAQALASDLAAKSPDSLRLLKSHLSQPIRELAEALRTTRPAQQAPVPGVRRQIAAPGEHLRLETAADNVLLVRLCRSTQPREAGALVADLCALMTGIDDRAACQAIVLASDYPDFLPVSDDAASLAAALALRKVLRTAPLPVVAALGAQATGKAWLLAQTCDGVVQAGEGTHGIADCLDHPSWTDLVARILAERYGDNVARGIVLGGGAGNETAWTRGIGPVPVVAEDRLIDEAVALARSWAGLPQDALMASRRDDALGDWRPADPAPVADAASTMPHGEPTAIPLASTVIAAQAHADGVVVVRMEDRDAKNLFSPAFVAGMNEVFRHIDETPGYKVVVLTGHDSYFACGGTREALEAIQSGRARFTDEQTYLLALSCRIPVIAAMQGHGIGGGLSLGLFADFAMLGEESKYLSPYMNYGFTPGAGATLIVPEKLGRDLGIESLFAAREMAGSELRDRAVALAVHQRRNVFDAAMALARHMARRPRSTLVRLKQTFNRSIHERMERTTQQELAMHQKTFVGRTDTLDRIQSNFNPSSDAATPPPAEQAGGAVPPAHSLQDIVACLKALLAQELHMQLDDVDEDTAFVDLGLDSITGVTWMRRINERYGTSIQATKVYSHPTLSTLGPCVQEEIAKLEPVAMSTAPAQPARAAVEARVEVPAGAGPTPAAMPRPPLPARSGRNKLASWRNSKASRADGVTPAMPPLEPIAVIGMAGQFPMAKRLDDYWDNIAHGRNCVSEIPKARWDVHALYQEGDPVPGKTNSRWMGHLEEYDLFDPMFFDISPKEAMSMDPQQRVLLQSCWQAIESAGLDPRSLSGSRCGVFVGCGPGDYHLLSRELQTSALGFTGGDTAILAARLSYFLNLQGPCLAIETACSSSLVAIATACDSLVARNSDIALASGVCVMTGHEVHLKMAQTGMLSPDGRCFTFDQRANGFVPAEGVGTLVLKRLSDAERDHDIVLGVIHGWGVNQDGKTNGITAPNPDAQTRLEQEVYEKFGIDPAGIQLVEAHGTGTRLGDPIEVDALKQAFAKFTRKKQYCALGSVKSNIGHCFTAAGVASVIKVLLALQHRQLPPTINFTQLNQHIGLDDSPFYVNERLQPWETAGGQRRQAAVSGFGFGGTNAHVVIGEYVAPVRSRPEVSALTEHGKLLVPLSANTAPQLKQKAADLLEYLSGEGGSVDLVDMAYTLQTGREAMDERLCCLVGTVDELAARLKNFIAGDHAMPGMFQGRARDHKEAMSLLRRDAEIRDTIIDKLIAQRSLSKLADLWVRTLDIDWNRLYGSTRPQRVRLPVYPFAKDRYWIDDARPVMGKDVRVALQADADASVDFEICSRGDDGDEADPCRSRAATNDAAAPAGPPVVSGTPARVRDELRESLADALFMKASDIDADKPFIELGLDSIVGVEWINEINKRYKLKLTATKLYDHPSIVELAAFLEAEIEKTSPSVAQTAPAIPSQPAPTPSATNAGERDAPREAIPQARLQQELKESLAEALFLKASEIAADKPFIELGLDSIVGVEWINTLNRKYGVKVKATTLYDHPNIEEFASFLAEAGAKRPAPAPTVHQAVPAKTDASPAPAARRADPAPASPAVTRHIGPATPAKARRSPSGDDRIAIIGMSGRYPQAKNLERYWSNLVQGKSAITEIPPSRWDVDSHYDPDPKKDDKIYCKWIGMLDDIDHFDPLFFRISPAEAKNMDPQHRMFLEEGYRAFEDAGYSGKALANRKCGVYLGNIGSEYSALVSNADDITGNNPAIGAARIAYFLNLKGPAISIDTACSASLVAIHLACQGLLNHETDMALAGGASIYLRPETYAGMCRAGMLSPDGLCKTFDNGANGFVPGEGVGAVVLKRLSDAERDNDVIHGVILGSGINQDGRTNGITAPSVASQIELEREVYDRHGIDPATIGYVETHGTGTKLGDPIELEALATVFAEKTSKRRFCALGSVKSNIGHASGAAGVASLHKVLLCMRHRTLVPSLNVTKENALFDFANSPFYVSRETHAWEAAPDSPLRAAVSSFGFSGTNAHLVVEEYIPPAARRAVPVTPGDEGVIIALSARSAEQLQQRARDLLTCIRQEARTPSFDLASLAYTLLVGRDAMDERLAIVARSLDQLASALDTWLGGRREVDGLHCARVERGEDGSILMGRQQGIADLVRRYHGAGDLVGLAQLWSRGLELDWSALHPGAVPQRISLPTYPFARKRCWVDAPGQAQPLSLPNAATSAIASEIHPLVHRNISVLGQQSYGSVFRGDEPFLIEHAGQKLLPAAAYLEMARIAVANALPAPPAPQVLELRDVAWGRPLAAAADRQVNIILSRSSDERIDFEIYSSSPSADDAADEIVHCQGRAGFVNPMTPEPAESGQREGELQLRLPEPIEDRPGRFMLHPETLRHVLAAGSQLMARHALKPEHPALPFALDSIRLQAAGVGERLARVRLAADGLAQRHVVKLDIDLHDRSGNVCAQLRGVAYDVSPSPEEQLHVRVVVPAADAR